MKGTRVRVMCVDGHNLVRECVIAVLEREAGVRIVANLASTATDRG